MDELLGLLCSTQGAWQQSLGYVPQEIFLTDTSFAENIALGIPKAQIEQAQVKRRAHTAQVHDLPARYEILVGEQGVRHSGWQRQRIGIALVLLTTPKC